MNRFAAPILALLCITAACGVDQTNGAQSDDVSATAAAAIIHKIQPLGVSSACYGSAERVVRDHRTTPPTTYSLFLLAMKGCAPAESSLQILMLGGQQWVGGWSYVTIRKNGLCLTNPIASASPGTDRGESFWQACVAQNGASPERFRQQWLLSFNNNNAMRIETHAAVNLGLPGGQVQCLDRQDPTTVKRVACTLNNWQIIRAN